MPQGGAVHSIKSRHLRCNEGCPLYPRLCCKTRLLAAVRFGCEYWLFPYRRLRLGER